MHKFNSANINGFLHEFEEITLKIGALLGRGTKPDNDYITELTELYGTRRNKLEQLNEWLQTMQGQEFKSKYKDSWNSYIERIMRIERNNIKEIKNSVDNLNMDLKKLINSKNVLIYIKR